MKITPKVLVQVKECDLCKMAIRVERSEGRAVAFDVHSGEQHECWEMLPDDVDPMVLDDD